MNRFSALNRLRASLFDSMGSESPYQNEERARCQRFGGAARREEGSRHGGDFMDLRPTSNAAAATKIWQPGGLFSGGRLAALLLSQRALRLSSFVAPCQPPARKQRAHSPFCYGLLIRLSNCEEILSGANLAC